MRTFVPIAALSVACAVDLPAPTPRSVSPRVGYNGEDTFVTIEGEAFFPQVEVDATRRDGADVDAGFTVRLLSGEARVADLRGVGLVDFAHLEAVVPAGLPVGTYALEVVGPAGTRGRLDAAFTVTDIRADRIALDVDAIVYEVFDTAWVDVALVDVDGDRVLADLEVEVTVAGVDGPVDAAVDPIGLDDPVPLPGGGVRGRLGADGRGRFGVSVGTPGTTDILVSPADSASAIADGLARVLWEPGSELSLTIDLPAAGFVATAGEPFPVTLGLVDQFGNRVTDATETVLLKNACQTWVDAVQVPGTASVDVQLRAATGTVSCPEDRILSVSGPPGESVPFDVRPGPVRRFDVVVTPTVVVAGDDEINVFVTPVDAFGNLTEGSGGGLTLTESTGEVLTAGCVGVTPIFCTAIPTVAGAGLTLRVADGSGISGISNPHDVLPGVPVAVDVAIHAEAVVAGVATPVSVGAVDRFGNPVDLGGVAAAEVAIAGVDGETPLCSPGGAVDDGRIHLDCTWTRAVTATAVSAGWSGLSATSVAVPVVNGPLAQVIVSGPTGPVEAGEPVGLSFDGRDAFGNPYVVQSDPVLAVSDGSGTLSLTEVVLGGTGVASATGTFTRAGTTEVIVSQSDGVLGRSAPIEVTAAPAERLVLAPSAPWAWVGEDLSIAVFAVDAFGNRAASAAIVSVGSGTGAVASRDVPLDDGRGEVVLRWPAPDFDESLVASADGLVAGSVALPVVAACGGSGPIASLTFDGHASGVACVDGADLASVPVSFGGSVAGDAPIAGRVLAEGSDRWLDVAEDVVVDLAGVGRHEIAGLVVDAAGCADAVVGEAWLGPDDGTPTGPVVVVPEGVSLGVGEAGAVVAIEGVTDCRRTPAGGAALWVFTDRGALGGVTASGTGLEVVLDSAGDAAVTLDATATATGGEATVVARTRSGSARGEATVSIVGDVRRPFVVAASPAGQWAGLVDSAWIAFSEPLLSSTVQPGAFRIDGPSPPTVVGAVLDETGSRVTLTLDPPVAAGSAAWSLVAGRDLRDRAGNKLDGAWSGASFDFAVAFGDVPGPPPPPTGCTIAPAAFRPDGDDGDGLEADGAVLSWAAATTPVWWVLEVHDAADRRVRTAYVAPVSASDAWRWDGRADDEGIVPDGTYTVSVAAEDDHGNRTAPCSAEVVVSVEADR